MWGDDEDIGVFEIDKAMYGCVNNKWPMMLRRYVYALAMVDARILYFVGRYERDAMEDPALEELVANVADDVARYMQVPDFFEADQTSLEMHKCFGFLTWNQLAWIRMEALLSYAYFEIALAVRSRTLPGPEDVMNEYLRRAQAALLDAHKLIDPAYRPSQRAADFASSSLAQTVLRDTSPERRRREIEDLLETIRQAMQRE
jgi:hypothetical protein